MSSRIWFNLVFYTNHYQGIRHYLEQLPHVLICTYCSHFHWKVCQCLYWSMEDYSIYSIYLGNFSVKNDLITSLITQSFLFHPGILDILPHCHFHRYLHPQFKYFIRNYYLRTYYPKPYSNLNYYFYERASYFCLYA